MSAIETVRARMDEYRDRYQVRGDHAVSVLRSEFEAAIREAQAQALEDAVEHLAEVHAGLDESPGLTSAMGHLGQLADRKRSEPTDG